MYLIEICIYIDINFQFVIVCSQRWLMKIINILHYQSISIWNNLNQFESNISQKFVLCFYRRKFHSLCYQLSYCFYFLSLFYRHCSLKKMYSIIEFLFWTKMHLHFCVLFVNIFKANQKLIWRNFNFNMNFVKTKHLFWLYFYFFALTLWCKNFTLTWLNIFAKNWIKNFENSFSLFFMFVNVNLIMFNVDFFLLNSFFFFVYSFMIKTFCRNYNIMTRSRIFTSIFFHVALIRV